MCSGMRYPSVALPESALPQAAEAAFQHVIDTYASEVNKLAAVWSAFSDADLSFRPHPKSSTVGQILTHELLSGRRFFAEFLGAPEPPPELVLPDPQTIDNCCRRMATLARRRLEFLATRSEEWWLAEAPFFDIKRQRIWIFWRRVLHTAHHRSQLTVYLRLLDSPVPSCYGPTADVTWEGADPTHSPDAAGRR